MNIGFYDDLWRHDPPIDSKRFRERGTTVLTLTDAAGGRVRVNPFFWQDTPSLVGAIRSAAVRTRADLTPAAREYLGLDAERGQA